MTHLITGLEAEAGAYLRQEFPALPRDYQPSFAFGWVSDAGALIAVLVGDIAKPWEASLAFHVFQDGWRPTRREFCRLAEILFVERGVKRLTAYISKRNKVGRKLVDRVGFKLEGVKLLGFDGINDQCIYGMTYRDCPWLKGIQNGRFTAAAA